MTVTRVDPTDWTWLLRVPVKDGEPCPMEFWFLYQANTILPMQRQQPEVAHGTT